MKVVIIGGGADGLSAALAFRKQAPELFDEVSVLERGAFPDLRVHDAEPLKRIRSVGAANPSARIGHRPNADSIESFLLKASHDGTLSDYPLRLIYQDPEDLELIARRLSELCEARGVDIRYDVEATRILERPDAVDLHYRDASGWTTRCRTDYLLSTLPSDSLSALSGSSSRISRIEPATPVGSIDGAVAAAQRIIARAIEGAGRLSAAS